MGATAAGSTLVDADLVRRLRIPPAVVDAIVRRATAEVHRRETRYWGARAPLEVEARTVLVVDDGLATGATAQAAVRALRAHAPRRIVFAAPVCSQDGAAALRAVADAVECLECPIDMWAVGYWYRDFSATTDAEVIRCLRSDDLLRVTNDTTGAKYVALNHGAPGWVDFRQAALPIAFGLARRDGATVHLVRVDEPPTPVAGPRIPPCDDPEIDEDLERKGRRYWVS